MRIPHFVHPVIYPWTLGLPPPFGCCEQCSLPSAKFWKVKGAPNSREWRSRPPSQWEGRQHHSVRPWMQGDWIGRGRGIIPIHYGSTDIQTDPDSSPGAWTGYAEPRRLVQAITGTCTGRGSGRACGAWIASERTIASFQIKGLRSSALRLRVE